MYSAGGPSTFQKAAIEGESTAVVVRRSLVERNVFTQGFKTKKHREGAQDTSSTVGGKGLDGGGSGDGGGAGLLRRDGWLLGGGSLARGWLGELDLAQGRLGRFGVGDGAGRTARCRW
jgi:hypothetical protein